ncbi:hypothetical protein ACQEU3_11225 [Spirillospora sp. CA-253888]
MHDDTSPDIPVTLLRQAAAAGLRERFPGVHCWWGRHTRKWWAYLPGNGLGLLLEADTLDGLTTRIIQARRRP